MRKWGHLMNLDTNPELSKSILKEMLEGYVGITDTWGASMTPELLELYPDAIVICTTREEEAWWKSWSEISKDAPRYWVMQAMFLPVPVMRFFPNSAHQVWRR
jgi:hypothetical protein